MKLQDQVITIQQAKRLKELGIVGESAFNHFKASFHAGVCLGGPDNLRHVWALTGSGYDREDVEFTPAYTVTEMGRMIGSGTFAAQKFHDAVADRINSSHSMTIAAAPQFIGNFLIAALEQGILTPSEANTRLSK